VEGYYYWIMRMNAEDAAARGIKKHDLVKVFNERGAVICAADVSPMVARGVLKSYESSAEFQPRVINGETVDIGGCMNMLTSSRPQMKGTSSMSPNSCLVEVTKWTGRAA
jgi:trimethylamine-N-oxide reductase (cytochrome c)